MNLFLTSNIGGIKKQNGNKIPIKFFENNDFLDNLKKAIKNNKKFVLIASDPDDYERNDLFLQIDIEALKISGLTFEEYLVLDGRGKKDVTSILKDCNLIFLCGGNTLIQNTFFNSIGLEKYLKNIDSVIVGISAGSINSASDVYNSPESSEDLNNSPYLKGLGLTTINIEPHFKIEELDDKNYDFKHNEIINESYKRTIIGLTDGAYILENCGECRLYGEGYIIKNGAINKICDNDEYINLNEYV